MKLRNIYVGNIMTKENGKVELVKENAILIKHNDKYIDLDNVNTYFGYLIDLYFNMYVMDKEINRYLMNNNTFVDESSIKSYYVDEKVKVKKLPLI